MMTPELISILQCPTCREDQLRLPDGARTDFPPENGEIRCEACGATYPIRFGVPVLMPNTELNRSEWELWTAHLEKFQARRETRVKNPRPIVSRLAAKSQPQPPFAEFIQIKEGAILDIGCGPGNFRFHFDPDRVAYFGLDPIVLPEVRDFPFVQGISEYIPFQADAFTDVVVLAALDHFRDPDLFFEEAARVLRPGGRLHILQSIHEVRGPVSAVKVLAHKVKDAIDDRDTAEHDRRVPKHLNEFSLDSLMERMSARFDIKATDRYSGTWFSPEWLFLSGSPNRSRNGAAPAGAVIEEGLTATG
jgi:SAM-dependent methyltransferase